MLENSMQQRRVHDSQDMRNKLFCRLEINLCLIFDILLQEILLDFEFTSI